MLTAAARSIVPVLAEPNRHLTTLSGSELWQPGALEMWMQADGA